MSLEHGAHIQREARFEAERIEREVKVKAEQLRQKAALLRQKVSHLLNPHLRAIQENLRRKIVQGKLVCPTCGDSDRDNRMNGKPWCFKCKEPLALQTSLKKRKRFPNIKVLDKHAQQKFLKQQLNPGLYPDKTMESQKAGKVCKQPVEQEPCLDGKHCPEYWPTGVGVGVGGGRGDYVYLVESDGTNATVYDNQGVVVHGPSANDETEVNWALANLTAGRTWKERVVTLNVFVTRNPVITYDYTILDITGTEITLANGSNCNMIENSDRVNGNQFIEIWNGILQGNKANQANGDGVNWQYIRDSSIFNLKVYDCDEHGIHLTGQAGDLDRNMIDDCYVYGCDLNGFFIQTMNRSQISNCTAQGNGSRGFRLQTCMYQFVITECNAWSNLAGAGFEFEGCNEITTDACMVYGCLYGIRFWGGGAVTVSGWSIFGASQGGIVEIGSAANAIIITGCYIGDNGLTANNTYDQIYSTGDRWVVTGNYFHEVMGNKTRHAINCQGDYWVISGNILYGGAGDGVHLEGANHCNINGNVIYDFGGYGIELDADTNYARATSNTTTGNTTGCANVANVNCDNNVFTQNNFDEGNIADVGTNTRAWLNYDPSANVFIATINAPIVVGGGGGALP